LTENQELNVWVFKTAMLISKENYQKKAEDLIEGLTHGNLIKIVCEVELNAIENIAKKGYPIMDHQYYSLYRGYPNYEIFRRDYEAQMKIFKKQFEYVHEDPSMLISMEDGALEIFRFILKGALHEDVYKLNIPKDPEEAKTYFFELADTWSLLYLIESERGRVTPERGEFVDMVFYMFRYFQLTEKEMQIIAETFNPELLQV